MEQNFDSGPGFRAMVQNGPEMAQNGKSLTTPTVFKVWSSFLGWCWPTQGPKNHGTEFWSGSRFSSYGPNWVQNGPKLETEEFCNILGRPFIFLENVDLPKAQKVVVSFLHFIRPIWRRGVSSLTATETLKQGHRLFSVILMLRGSSAHSIIDRPSFMLGLDTDLQL